MKILVGYDGSNVAKEALNLALTHATAFNASIFIVTSMIGGPEVPREDFVHAENKLKFAQAEIDTLKVPCETRLLVRGLTPGEDLVQFAEELQIDEIIIGVKRRSKVGKLLFGSTAQYVILQAPCPVVTIK